MMSHSLAKTMVAVVFWGLMMAFGVNSAGAAPDAKTILDGIAKRYGGTGFSAQFTQTATISAIDVTDSARGIIYVKRPGMMRWEYEKPEPQLIISNGKTLWIYRPEEKQVMMGDAPDYLGEGKGVGFLSDIEMLKHNFVIVKVDENKRNLFRLKLIPRKPIPDMSDIHLYVTKSDYDIIRIATYNQYGDETIIHLHNQRLDLKLDDDMFTFVVPPETEVLKLTPNE